MSHQKSLYAFILASVRNYADANDILQETATIMWRKFGEFDKGTNFVGWGISISRNLIKKYFRERKMSRVQFGDKLFQDISEKVEKGLDKMDSRLDALECPGKGQLPLVVQADNAFARFLGKPQTGQNNRQQKCDNRNDNQQFNQCKSASFIHHSQVFLITNN
jgi:RNA polymerase sigma factor (sigma-70 family)